MSPTIDIPVYYDFASSLCYVAHRVMERMQAEIGELGLWLRWTPIDLTRLSGWRRGDKFEGGRRLNAERVARELSVSLVMPETWQDSREAGGMALLLAGSERERVFRERVWRDVYESGRSLEDTDWLAGLARELDVAPAGREGVERLTLNTIEAAEREVSGVPSFVLGGWPLGGIQEDATMRSLFSRYAARRRGVH